MVSKDTAKNETSTQKLKTLLTWKQQQDVFFIKYGGLILASASACSGLLILKYYRNLFRLKPYRKDSYLSVSLIPAVASFVLHTEYVLPLVALQNTCPVCLQIRGSALQSTCGLILPALLAIAPITSNALALKYGTYNMPYFNKKPFKALRFSAWAMKPIGSLLFALFACHALLGSTVTYLESWSVKAVNEQIKLKDTNMHL